LGGRLLDSTSTRKKASRQFSKKRGKRRGRNKEDGGGQPILQEQGEDFTDYKNEISRTNGGTLP